MVWNEAATALKYAEPPSQVRRVTLLVPANQKQNEKNDNILSAVKMHQLLGIFWLLK